jgi:hypothetical protein
MTPKQAYFGLLGILALLVCGLLGGAYGVNSLMEKQSHQLVSLKTQLAGLNQQQTELTTAKNDIAKYSPLYNIAKVIVPESKDQAETVREIVNLAADNGVSLASITFPSSSLGASSSGAAASPAITTPSASKSGSSSLSQLVPVATLPGVYSLPITVSSSNDTGKQATYPQLIGFLSALENNRKTALVSNVNIVPNTQNHSLLSFTLALNIYIKP